VDVTASGEHLARFLDRWTLVYERTYRHPIGRVWEAVTTAEHLEAWMLPETRVDARLGGACAFGWGGPADAEGATHPTITVFEPPTAVQYTDEDGSFMRFDLRAVEDGRATELAFTLHFLPGKADTAEDYPGGDLPAGRDTAWRPGVVAGFHEMVDQLAGFLAGTWTLADNLEGLRAFETDPAGDATHQRWVEVYRAHIREHCPPA
jgi:uncharacterized protein YndB with AHSA1/START domain